MRLLLRRCLWGRPLVEIANTLLGGLAAGAVQLDGLRYYDDLKTASDRFVVTPNNVTIDGYGASDLRSEPIVGLCPRCLRTAGTSCRLATTTTRSFTTSAGTRARNPASDLITGPDHHGRVPRGWERSRSARGSR